MHYTRKWPNYSLYSHSTHNEVHSAVTLLEKNLFVRASELLDRVTVAAKDASGKVRSPVRVGEDRHRCCEGKQFKPLGGFHQRDSIHFSTRCYKREGTARLLYSSRKGNCECKRPARKRKQAANGEEDTSPPPHSHNFGSLPPPNKPSLASAGDDSRIPKPKVSTRPPDLPASPIPDDSRPPSVQDAPGSSEQVATPLGQSDSSGQQAIDYDALLAVLEEELEEDRIRKTVSQELECYAALLQEITDSEATDKGKKTTSVTNR